MMEWLDLSWAALECGAARLWEKRRRDEAEHETAKHSRSSLMALMRVKSLAPTVVTMLSLALTTLSRLATCTSGENMHT
jgi:hypothetical protein